MSSYKDGANKFLQRLDTEFKKINIVKNFNIYLPNKFFKHKLKSNKEKINIVRLDGVSHYKFTIENLLNFITLRYNISLPNFLFKNLNIDLITKFINNYLNRYNQYMISNCDGIVFQSNLSYQFHKKFINLNNKKYKIILNGTVLSLNKNYPKLYQDNYPNIVISATFRPHKRLIEAINIINNLKKKFSKIKLHVIGSIDRLTQKKLNKINCENIILHGFRDQKFMNLLYHNCNVGLSPSYLDPCPNSVVEMLSCGLPVITTTASGAFELVNYLEDFSVNEDYKLDYIEIQSFDKIPSINIQKWSNKIIKIIENQEYFKNQAIDIFKNNLEINLIANKYINFINELKS